MTDHEHEMYRNTHGQPRRAHLFERDEIGRVGGSTERLADDAATSVCGLAQSYGPFVPTDFETAEADAYDTLCGTCMNLWRGRRDDGSEEEAADG